MPKKESGGNQQDSKDLLAMIEKHLKKARQQQEHWLAEVQRLENARASYLFSGVGGRPANVLKTYLKECKLPVDFDTALQIVRERGAILHPLQPEANFRRSVGLCVGAKTLKVVNDRIGLPDWPDSLFKK